MGSLTNENLKLAYYLVHRYVPKFAREEGIQEAVIGMLRAEAIFDPSRGVSFGHYASIYIRGHLQGWIRRQAAQGFGGARKLPGGVKTRSIHRSFDRRGCGRRDIGDRYSGGLDTLLPLPDTTTIEKIEKGHELEHMLQVLDDLALTPRQESMIRLRAKGRSHRFIAMQHKLSKETVRMFFIKLADQIAPLKNAIL